MNKLQNAVRHSTATIALHWGTVLAIVLAVVAVYLREVVEEKALRQTLLDVHRQLGLLVMLGLILRLAVRYAVGLADHAAQLPAMLRWVAWLTHMALYAMLIAVPVLGWAASNAHAVHVHLFGVLPLPDLVNSDPDMAETLDDYHKWVAWAGGVLISLHASAALWHHYRLQDAVLTAMLPSRRAK